MAAADWGGMNAAYPQASEQTPAQSLSVTKIVNVAGGLLSATLIVGLGVWGYKLAMRDVTGIPVVRALEGPMRVQPEDPGGIAAAHQGLAVNAVAAAGPAEGPVNEVVLAPAPVALAEGDLPARTGAEVSATLAAEAGDAVAPNAADSVAAALIDAIAEADPVSAAPPTGGSGGPVLTSEAEAAIRLAAAVIPADVPGVARSPRPSPRPDDLAVRAAVTPPVSGAPAGPAAPVTSEVSATAVPAGTRLVQLGAFDSEEVARAEWDKLAIRFEDVLDGKGRVIERAQSGGKTFYRLRAMGFEDLSDARRFCSALMAGQAACIPVVTR